MKISKKIPVLISLLLLGLTACGSTDKEKGSIDVAVKTEVKAAEFTPFVSREGNFSINFPGEPEMSSSILGESGDLTLTMYSYSLNDTDALAVSYTSDDVSVVAKDARGSLKAEQGGVLEAFGVTAPEEEKEMDYEGKYPGLRYRVSGNGNYVVAQTYLVGARLYQIVMFKSGSYPTDKEVKDFTDSFRFLK